MSQGVEIRGLDHCKDRVNMEHAGKSRVGSVNGGDSHIGLGE